MSARIRKPDKGIGIGLKRSQQSGPSLENRARPHPSTLFENTIANPAVEKQRRNSLALGYEKCWLARSSSQSENKSAPFSIKSMLVL